MLQAIFSTDGHARALVVPDSPLAELLARLTAAGRTYELALFIGRQSTRDVTAADYRWNEADFTTATGMLFCDGLGAEATHIGVIIPGGSGPEESPAAGVWIAGTERGGMFGYTAAFFAL